MCVYTYNIILYIFISCHSNIQREKERIEASIKRQDDKTREQVEERHHQRERERTARESEMDVPRRDRDSTSNERNDKLVLFISIVTYNSYYII